jgi:hypothetical protein
LLSAGFRNRAQREMIRAALGAIKPHDPCASSEGSISSAFPQAGSAESRGMRQQKITLGEKRESGVSGPLVYCFDYKCSHLKTMTPAEVDKWPDDVRLSDLEPRFVCKRCGVRGSDIRPDFAPARMGTQAAFDFRCDARVTPAAVHQSVIKSENCAPMATLSWFSRIRSATGLKRSEISIIRSSGLC